MLPLIMLLMVAIFNANGNESEGISKNCELETDSPDYFLYFAYGSNLLPKRMHINVPTAKNCSTARLDGWRLDFNNLTASNRWNGAVATIVEDEAASVIGNIWRISVNESDKLDRQEGVDNHWYKKVDLKYVLLRNNATVTARTYTMVDVPPKVDPERIPPKRQPSRTYLQVILFGAIECNIPVSHIEYIQRFPHNGRIAPSLTRKALGYPFYDSTYS